MIYNKKLKFNKQFFSDFFTLFIPFWTSKEKWMGLLLLGLNISCLLGEVRLNVAINKFDKQFFDALQTFNKEQIVTSLWQFGIILLLFVFSLTYSIYFNRLLGIRWRKWLTSHYLERWLDKNNYYHLQFFNQQIDNPDQRLSEDIDKFVFSSLSLFSLLVHSVITFFAFGYILWHLGSSLVFTIGIHLISIPHYLFYSAIFYALLGTYLTSAIGKKLPFLDYQQQQFDASFRYNLVKCREASEQISIMRGEKLENKKLNGLFSSIVLNYGNVIGVQRNLMFFSHCYKTLITLYGYVLAMPLFFAKKIMMGGVMQIISALKGVIGSFSLFVTSFSMIAEWRATIARISDFKRSLDLLGQTQSSIRREHYDGEALTIHNLQLRTPEGQILLPSVNFTFNPGTTVLISGYSSIEKSTLLKAISGIWPYGEGLIKIPLHAKLMFIPQKIYFSQTTLSEILLYPNAESAVDLAAVLSLFELKQYINELNEVKNWEQELCLSEKQKMSFARIFIQRPDFVILDESTSALDEKTEYKMYKGLKNSWNKLTIITLGHRRSLYPLHETSLLFSNEQNQFVTIASNTEAFA